jgi:hypothetical protein
MAEKSRHLFCFLIIIRIFREFTHIPYLFVYERGHTIEVEHPYIMELGNSLFAPRFPEGGFQGNIKTIPRLSSHRFSTLWQGIDRSWPTRRASLLALL